MKQEGFKVTTIENTDKPGDHRERPLESLETAYIDKDQNERLRYAQESIVNNNKLKELFLKANIDIDFQKNPRKFAQVEDLFVSTLQDLSDNEIDSVIRQFNSKFKEYVSKQINLDISNNLRRKIFENDSISTDGAHGNIHSKSIKNVIHFIRSRRQLLESGPSQKYGLYFEHSLDAHNKIDLVECIFEEFDGETHIAVMNLIQIKSSTPTVDEQQKITKAHRDWITSSVMDLENFEREYSDGIPPGLTIEMLSQNADEIEGLLQDLCTQEGDFNPDGFIKNLNLEETNNKHKAWLLTKYNEVLKRKIREVVTRSAGTEYEIEQAKADLIIERLTQLEEKVRVKAKLPRNLSYIDTINSITAVGKQIVHEETLVTHTEEKAKRKIVKIQ